MSAEDILHCEINNGVARITMNRPEKHNAFNAELIQALYECFLALRSNKDVRVVLLCGAGKSFSAGADAEWMRQAGKNNEAENHADALRLAQMLQQLNTLPQPVVALVQGAAVGGGMGLVCACDIALAAEKAFFATSEVRLGLAPSTISPYVLSAIGVRQASRYFLTAERINAYDAKRIGIVHEVCAENELENCAQKIIDALLQGGSGAQSSCKELIRNVAYKNIDESLLQETAAHIAFLRSQEEAVQGLSAFLQKRTPPWCPSVPSS